MPGKISELAVLTGAVANGADLLETVDVSDTSMASTGTNKKMSLTNLMAFLNVNGVGASNEVFVGPNDPIATYPEAELWLDTDAVVALSADERWNTAWGLVGQSVITTAQLGIDTTPVVLTGSAVTVTAVAGRRYRIAALLAPQATNVPSNFTVTLRRDGTGFQVRAGNTVTGGLSHHMYVEDFVSETVTGAHTYDVTMYRQTGTGTVGNYADNAVRSLITVEDVGPTILAGSTPQPTTGSEAIKPATPNAGFRYFATDTKREWLYDGTGWIVMGEPLQTYTPSTTNTTLGTGGTSTGSYHRNDGWCDVTMHLGFGTGGTFTGQPTIGLPNASAYVPRYQFAVMFYWIGTNVLRGTHAEVMTGQTFVTPFATGGDVATGREFANNLSASAPFTWGAGSSMVISGRYRLNSRYS